MIQKGKFRAFSYINALLEGCPFGVVDQFDTFRSCEKSRLHIGTHRLSSVMSAVTFNCLQTKDKYKQRKSVAKYSTLQGIVFRLRSFMSAIPLEQHGLALNKQDFRDSLHLCYNLPFPDLPSHFVCGEKFTISHALSCKKGGLCSPET